MAMQNCFKRYEKKYCLTKAQQRVILEGMHPYMKKDTYGQYTISTFIMTPTTGG